MSDFMRLARIRSFARNLFHRARVDRDLGEEIQAYTEMLVDEKRHQGVAVEEAVRAARIEMGGAQQVKEQVRDVSVGEWLHILVRDVRYGARMLHHSPGFALITILTLALGIGANTAIFSFVNGLLLRELPYADAGRLLYVSEYWPHEPVFRRVPGPDFGNWRARGGMFDGIEGYTSSRAFNMTGGGESERVEGSMVTAGFLNLLGLHPAISRNFTREEDRPGAVPTIVISHRLWERHFDSAPGVIGKLIELDGRAYNIVGVLPASFVFPDNEVQIDLLLPLALPGTLSWHDPAHFVALKVLARLKPGAKPDVLGAELAAIARSTTSIEPPQFVNMRRDMDITVTPLRERLSGNVRAILLILQGAVAMVLMIGCLNVATLQIARATSRQREIALRVALGASRLRIIRQLLTENVLLSLLGGTMGLGLSYEFVHMLRPFLPADLSLLKTVRIDTAVLGFTFVITVLTGIGTGFASLRGAFRTSLKLSDASGRTTSSTGQHRVRAALVVVQVAMAMVLLSGSGLLVRAFVRLTSADPGFDPRGVLTLRVALRGSAYAKPQDRSGFVSRVLDLAKGVPGVQSIAVAGGAPILGTPALVGTAIEGRPFPAPGAAPDVACMPVSPDYFHTLGIALIGGRIFMETDREGSPQVAIINQAFAREFFPGQNPIGKHIKTGAMTGPWRQVVGIVRNVQARNPLDREAAEIYVPFVQGPVSDIVLLLKSTVPPTSVAAEAERLIHAVDPNQPVYDLATMEQRLSSSLSAPRSNVVLMGTLASLALLLAGIGIFGVLSYFVNRRSREIAIRLALGARQSDLLKMVFGHGLALTGAGIALGLAGSRAITWVLRTQLYGVSSSDPLTLVAVSMLFLCVAIAACYAPAHRAIIIDPMMTLRHD